MGYEPHPGRGNIFRNNRKKKPEQPDLVGMVCQLDGQMMEIAVWRKKTQGDEPFWSIKLSKVESKDPPS